MPGIAGADTLDGGSGSDLLDGGLMADTLTGGAEEDSFRFSTALGNGNVDWINDFNVTEDTILLDNLIFANVGGDGALALGAFYRSAAGVAHDADDRIIYDTDSGALSYDADGTGQLAAIQYARLSSNMNLLADDFLII
jgi:Ca2+-binding RTX toxin-like protein